MARRWSDFNERMLASVLAVAFTLLAACIILIGFFPSIPSMLIGFVGIPISVITIFGCIIYGFIVNKAQHSGREHKEPNCRIMARYGVKKNAEVVPSDQIYYEDCTPYVRIFSIRRGAVELRCEIPVWEQCGEGMLGEAIIQGRWLSSFTPYIGAPPPP
jgi:hypothetical protein